MNKVVLMGRLTRDPELRSTTTGTMVTTFTLAVNRRFSKTNEADFINIVAWQSTAEFVGKYFKKGQQVAVIGRIQTRNYKNNNGQTVYVTEVIAEECYFADSKKDYSNGNSYESQMPDMGQPMDAEPADFFGDTTNVLGGLSNGTEDDLADFSK